jgi:cytochrome c-type biogenesis protein CcmH
MALFYALAGALALVTGLILVRPLMTGRDAAAPSGASDTALYRDQLDEIERDLARGTIDASEAEGARAEVSRRLLAATERAKAAAEAHSAPRLHSRVLAGAALIGAPVIAALLYLSLGMPGQPDQPFAERSGESLAQATRPSQAEAEAGFTPNALPLTGEQQEYVGLIERLETLLEERPNDAKGLELLANGYMRLGRHAESWRAFQKLAELGGERAEGQAGADLYASMAEAMVLATGGYVSPEAEQAIGEALVRAPAHPVARYYSGLSLAQSGRIDEAIGVWERLRAETPADAPWLGFLNDMLTEAKALRDGGAGPSAEQMEAAAAMSAEERQEMIEGMVARLEGRLASDGGEPEEWLRLMNAYVQLGRRDDAARVARLGIEAFGSSSEAGFLREQALLMGLFEE